MHHPTTPTSSNNDMIMTGVVAPKKSVRINDKPQDLRQLHSARMSRKLRRMKRRLLLDALADDPTNAGYAGSCSSMASTSRDSASFDEDNGEGAFRAARAVRYHRTLGCSSMMVDSSSSSSVYSDLTETDLHDIHRVVEQRRDDLGSCFE